MNCELPTIGVPFEVPNISKEQERQILESFKIYLRDVREERLRMGITDKILIEKIYEHEREHDRSHSDRSR